MDDQTTIRSPSSDLLVVAGGMATSALTLSAIFWLAAMDGDLEIMGLYALFVIPAGAIMVGIGAGSGYGLVSWLNGRKVSGRLLFAVACLLAIAYAVAQWLEYRSLIAEVGISVGFFEYYDVVTRSMQFSFGRASSTTSELGILGYLFRVLEIVGFMVGGLVVPLALRTKPYCKRCSTYMRSRSMGLIPAAVPDRKVKKRDAAGLASYQAAMKVALESGAEEAEVALKAADANDAGVIKGLVEKYAAEKKAIARLLHRFELVLSRCPRCDDGVVSCKLHSGHGNQEKSELVSARPVPATLSRMLSSTS